MSAGTVHLKSPSKDGVGLIQAEFPIKPNTTYVVRFEAKTTAQQALMIVDLYGENYDFSAQDRVIPNLSSQFRHYELWIPSGGVVPVHGFLRLYSVGLSPVDIRGVTFGVGRTTPIYRQVAATGEGLKVYYNPDALPRFRFVSHVIPGKDFEQVRAMIGDLRLDVRNTAVVEGIGSETNVENGRILRYRTTNNDLEWLLESGNRSFFVVGDTYFPGWHAYVDDREVPIYAVDGIVRGIFIDGAGQHRVAMHFRPWSIYAGIGTTAFGLCLALFVSWRDLRNKKVPARTEGIS